MQLRKAWDKIKSNDEKTEQKANWDEGKHTALPQTVSYFYFWTVCCTTIIWHLENAPTQPTNNNLIVLNCTWQMVETTLKQTEKSCYQNVRHWSFEKKNWILGDSSSVAFWYTIYLFNLVLTLCRLKHWKILFGMITEKLFFLQSLGRTLIYITLQLVQSHCCRQSQPSREQVMLSLRTPPIANPPQYSQGVGVRQRRYLWSE